MIEQVTKWKTSDGREHDAEHEAKEHEALLGEWERVKRWTAALPRDGDDAVPDRVRSRLANDVLRFLAWERENPQS